MRKKILFGGAAVGAGQVIGQGLSFVRNLIIARLVSPADFGIASTFAITVTLIEMISDLNAATLLIQAPDGYEQLLQNCAHAVSLIRGVVGSLVLFALSSPLSEVFGAPETAWAFRCLALYPLIRAATHLDATRMQRHMRFVPSVGIEVASQVVTVLVAWPLTRWLRDYSALLWLLLLQRFVASAASFLVAERPFALAWDRLIFRRMCTFGWPLLLNGLLMFVMMQGDRMVIGSSPRFFALARYTMADLGAYSVAAGAAMMTVAIVTKITLSLMLPTLAQAQQSPALFQKRYAAFAQALAITGGMMAVVFVIAGKSLILLMYGNNYALAGTLIGWLGAMQSIRIIRTAPTMAALAMGDTQNSLVSNIARGSSLFIAILMAAYGAPMVWLAAGGLIAEGLALVVSAWRLQRTHGLSMKLCLQPACLAASGMVAAWLAMSAGADQFGWMANGLTAIGIASILMLIWLACLPAEIKAYRQPLVAFLGRYTR